MFESIERIVVGHLPTPLEAAPGLSKELGVDLWIKRDDATGLAGGGNKVRKLEYLVADARARGANCLVTVGGPQSNHARMTAALAARLGMSCRLYLKGEAPRTLRGNLLLDKLLGAEVTFCGDADYPEIYQRIEADIASLREQGLEGYMIPVGGSSPVGLMGYVRMITEELVPQCAEQGVKPDALVVTAGSGGTLAGILLGLEASGWDLPVQSYSVSYPAAELAEKTAQLFNAGAKLLGMSAQRQGADIAIDEGHIGPGYGIATPGALEALQLFARREGLLLDSVYTAKTAAGMIHDIRGGRWAGKTVIFVHTGGWPALFAKDDVENFIRG